jgi:hypothetical protein
MDPLLSNQELGHLFEPLTQLGRPAKHNQRASFTYRPEVEVSRIISRSDELVILITLAQSLSFTPIRSIGWGGGSCEMFTENQIFDHEGLSHCLG